MWRNTGTVLAVFVCMFALASLVDRARTGWPGGTAGIGNAWEAASAAVRRAIETTPATRTPSIEASTGSPSAPAGLNPALRPADSLPADAESATAGSLPRNPPETSTIAGAGRFQLYRQGDITWRFDTETGRACVMFATDEQWRRPRVYEQGCADR